MPLVRLITGTARSGRSECIDTLLSESLNESLLVVPTNAYAQRRAAGLLRRTERAALLDPPVITFGDLAARILRTSELRAAPISPLEQRILLQRAVARAREIGSLSALGDAAESEGFLDHLLHVIGQLKQAAIEPDEFRRLVRKRRHAMDAVVAEVYGAYQDELNHAGAVDLQGTYWLARIECERGRPHGVAHVRRLVFDDFDDFTPSEFRVVRALAAHVEDLVFGLNLSDDPERKNLYAVPLATRDTIRSEFESAETQIFDEAPFERVSEFMAASLLVRREAAPPSNLVADTEFVEYHTLQHEIESIARRIKHIVRAEGTALARIAVVWRSVPAVAAQLREIFGEFGIPASGLESRTLAESASAGFVLRFLHAAQSWSPEAVLDVLTSPWFAGPATEHTHAFPILARAARPRATKQGWLGGMRRLQQYLDDPNQIELKRLLEHVPTAKAATDAMVRQLETFAAQAERLKPSASVSAHLSSLQAALEAWPFDAAVSAMPPGDARDVEDAAVPALRRMLAHLVEDAHGADDRRISLGAFAQSFRRALAAVQFATPAVAGGVACLGMEAARYLEFDYVFLAGLTDAQMPTRRKLSAIYTEDERADLSAAGIGLDGAEMHGQREILLFQRMFTIARLRLMVSWHRLAPGGATVQRSLYLEEVADRLGALRGTRPASPVDALVPPTDLCGSTRDVRNLAIMAGDIVHFPESAAAAAMERRRYGFEDFDSHDGQLTHAANVATLSERFGDGHIFSASRLEEYASCPFRFFQNRVLDLLDIEPPEQAFDHLALGSVLHGALQRFHERFIGRVVGDIPAEEAGGAMEECAGAAFDLVAARFRHLPPGVLAAERARTISTLQRHAFLQRHPKENAPEPWPPAHFEVAFGRGGEAKAGPAFALDTSVGTVRLEGRIDRIDRVVGRFRLIDYKRSPVERKDILAGRNFQLALYALAAEVALFRGETCEDALYVPIGHDRNPTVALSRSNPKAGWDERVATAREAVANAVAGIRAGRFHPALDASPCQGCTSQKVCRFERARMQRKARP